MVHWRVDRTKKKVPSPKRVPAFFFMTAAGGEPVREWLRSLGDADRKVIGADIMTVEFGWPVGMPASRPLGEGLHEVRSQLAGNRIARVIFYIDRVQRMVLLHAFIKKTRKLDGDEFEIAKKNKSAHERGLR